jgi:uncharacterized protein
VSIPVLLFLAAIWAGAQNALAGGGSFITLPLLIFSGMDARAANITSTIALFPAQMASGWPGRRSVEDAGGLSFRILVLISLAGGAVGAILLLLTPQTFFSHLLPWLLLFATGVFAWGSFVPRSGTKHTMKPATVGCLQACIAIYGGYFGGGIGFMMLAMLSTLGTRIRAAAAIKNVLAAVMNASAVAIFVFSPEVRWDTVAIYGAGAVIGGVAGGHIAQRVNEKALRLAVVLLGLALTVGLFLRRA